MYTLDIRIVGTAPLLQNRYPLPLPDEATRGTRRATAAIDYSQTWLAGMYVSPDGLLYQPARHLEGALARAGGLFKVKGGRGRSYRDLMLSYCFVRPEVILHQRAGEAVRAPDATLLQAPTATLAVHHERVIVNRAAVARARLKIAPGWELAFALDVGDDQLSPETLRTILDEAGRACGIGDFRPRYGRFAVVSCAVAEADALPDAG